MGMDLLTGELIQVVLKNIKTQKRQKWERKKLQLSQERFKIAILQLRWSPAEIFLRNL